MPTFLTRCAALWLLAVLSSVEVGIAQDATPERIDALVQQLGDTKFVNRAEAEAKLLEIGTAAREALREARQSDDLEIRYRALRLEELIQKQAHQNLLDRFLKEPTNNEVAALLPGWERFHKTVGSGKSDRLLFAQMQRTEPELMRLAEQASPRDGERIARRVREIKRLLRDSSAGAVSAPNISAVVFACSHPLARLPKDVAPTVSSIVHHTKFSSKLKANPEGVERRLIGQWLKSEDGGIDYQKTRFAMQFELREGVVPAQRVLESGATGHMLLYALLACGQLGSTAQLPQLERFFADTTLVTRSQAKTDAYHTQVRDVALLCALHATKQDHKNYGYERVRRRTSTLFDTNSCGFETDVARDSAFQLWEMWKASRLQPSRGARTTD